VGRLLRYVIKADNAVLGALSFTDPAWNLSVRDRFISELGLADSQLRDTVVCNNRFLILPMVEVPNLASRILGLAGRRLRHDWQAAFGVMPLYAETFVDPQRFAGTCYLAANWLCIGSTKGFSKVGEKHVRNGAQKLIFMRGLTTKTQNELILACGSMRKRAA
jgi:hypothetical protein